ncbi:MAG TPA: hypothetical protein VG777_00075 [Thermoanaerobaculia bacterium]|nr:hypothetical protein [Thermoanaerobaculia bacterium]
METEAEPRTSPTRGGSLRTAALAAATLGAAGSVALMLRAGRGNPSRVLILMFVVWVLSPFVLCVAADLLGKRWPASARMALHAATIVVALVTLAVYGGVVLGPPRPKIARFFLLVPPASVLFAAIVVGAAGGLRGNRGKVTR